MSIIFIIILYIYIDRYKEYPKTINVDNIVNIDSLKSKIEEDYRYKIDSISIIYNNKINQLQQRDKQLENKIKIYNTTIGELPDFK